MNKSQALDSFWNSFSLPAFDENSVPTGKSFPYITYQVATDSVNSPLTLSASLWYRESTWKNIADKAEEIAAHIGYSYRKIKFDDGYLIIYKGTPFAQRMNDPEDDLIKRIVLTITAEFLSEY